MKDYIIFSLRIPEEIHEELKEQAEKEKRSLNNMILVMIEKYIEEQQKNAK